MVHDSAKQTCHRIDYDIRRDESTIVALPVSSYGSHRLASMRPTWPCRSYSSHFPVQFRQTITTLPISNHLCPVWIATAIRTWCDQKDGLKALGLRSLGLTWVNLRLCCSFFVTLGLLFDEFDWWWITAAVAETLGAFIAAFSWINDGRYSEGMFKCSSSRENVNE